MPSFSLEEDFSVDEVTQEIKDFPLGKSPGPDCINNTFYKTFADLLLPFLCKVFNTISPISPSAPQSLEAYISVLPKPSKDPTACTNISLINVDVKIFYKIIASRLSPLILAIVHDDQVGCVWVREAWDNTNNTLLLVSHAQRHGIPKCLLSFDTKKAFDRVHCFFLLCSLMQIGLGPSLVVKIMALYEGPSARVMTNGCI